MQISILVFKRLYATKSEAANPILQATLMVETLDQVMEAQELAQLLLLFPSTFLMAHGLFNGHGSEEHLLLVITTHAPITRSQVDLPETN